VRSALRDCVREDDVKTQHREYERNRSKNTEEHETKATYIERRRTNYAARTKRHRQLRIERSRRLSHGRNEGCGISLRANDDRQRVSLRSLKSVGINS